MSFRLFVVTLILWCCCFLTGNIYGQTCKDPNPPLLQCTNHRLPPGVEAGSPQDLGSQTQMGYRILNAYKISSVADIPSQLQPRYNNIDFGKSNYAAVEVEVQVEYSAISKPQTTPDDDLVDLFPLLYCTIGIDNWSVVGSGPKVGQCDLSSCTAKSVDCLRLTKPLALNITYDLARWFLPASLQSSGQFAFDYMVFSRLKNFIPENDDSENGERYCFDSVSSNPKSPTSYGSCGCDGSGSCSNAACPLDSNDKKYGCPTNDDAGNSIPGAVEYGNSHDYVFDNVDPRLAYSCIPSQTAFSFFQPTGCPPLSNIKAAICPNMPQNYCYNPRSIFPTTFSRGPQDPNNPLTPKDVYSIMHDGLNNSPLCNTTSTSTACRLYYLNQALYGPSTRNVEDANSFTYIEPYTNLCLIKHPYNQIGTAGMRMPDYLYESISSSLSGGQGTGHWLNPNTISDASKSIQSGGPNGDYSALTCGACSGTGGSVCIGKVEPGGFLGAKRFFPFGITPICYASPVADTSMFEISWDLSVTASLQDNSIVDWVTYIAQASRTSGQTTAAYGIDNVVSIQVEYQGDWSQGNGFWSVDLNKAFGDVYGVIYCTDNAAPADEPQWSNNLLYNYRRIPVRGLDYQAVFPYAQQPNTGQPYNLCSGCTPLDQNNPDRKNDRVWFTVTKTQWDAMLRPASSCDGTSAVSVLDLTTRWYQTPLTENDDRTTNSPVINACKDMVNRGGSIPVMCRPFPGLTITSPAGAAVAMEQWKLANLTSYSSTSAQPKGFSNVWSNYMISSYMPDIFQAAPTPNVWLRGSGVEPFGLFAQVPKIPITQLQVKSNGQPGSTTQSYSFSGVPQVVRFTAVVNLDHYGISFLGLANAYTLSVIVSQSPTDSNLCPLVGAEASGCQPSTGVTSNCGKVGVTVKFQPPAVLPSTAPKFVVNYTDCTLSHLLVVPTSDLSSGSPFSIPITNSTYTIIDTIYFSTDGLVGDQSTCNMVISQVGTANTVAFTFQAVRCSTTQNKPTSSSTSSITSTPSVTPTRNLVSGSSYPTPSTTNNPTSSMTPSTSSTATPGLPYPTPSAVCKPWELGCIYEYQGPREMLGDWFFDLLLIIFIIIVLLITGLIVYCCCCRSGKSKTSTTTSSSKSKKTKSTYNTSSGGSHTKFE